MSICRGAARRRSKFYFHFNSLSFCLTFFCCKLLASCHKSAIKYAPTAERALVQVWVGERVVQSLSYSCQVLRLALSFRYGLPSPQAAGLTLTQLGKVLAAAIFNTFPVNVHVIVRQHPHTHRDAELGFRCRLAGIGTPLWARHLRKESFQSFC